MVNTKHLFMTLNVTGVSISNPACCNQWPFIWIHGTDRSLELGDCSLVRYS